ncbi:hypothetical protein [Vibrio maerlii]|uniref:hypothetical protein n=1 Tax=Vibrio maerlii TaxID=2231648 RepID=UPI000E3E624E|nr:hypothetical protein [Vibrio maerlii]
MKTTNKLLLAAAISNVLALNAMAAELHEFKSGDPALASEVNSNFSILDTERENLKAELLDDIIDLETSVATMETNLGSLTDRVSTLDPSGSGGDGGGTTPPDYDIAIDCNAEPSALADSLYSIGTTQQRVNYTLTGTCDAGVIQRGYVRIEGGAIAANTDLSDSDGESLQIGRQSNVRLVDVSLESNLLVEGNSNLRLENVTLPALGPIGSGDDARDRENITLNASTLYIKKGSVDNLALYAKNNSNALIGSKVTSSGGSYVFAQNNSVIEIDNNDLWFGFILSNNNSYIYGQTLDADAIYSEYNSMISTNNLYVSGGDNELEIIHQSLVEVMGGINATESDSALNIEIKDGSSLLVYGDVTAGTMACSFGSRYDIDGNLNLHRSFDFEPYPSVDMYDGCNGKVDGTYPDESMIHLGVLSAFNGQAEFYQENPAENPDPVM